MTELSDYRRLVEKPMRAAWAKERADLIAALQAAKSSATKWKAEAERMAEALREWWCPSCGGSKTYLQRQSVEPYEQVVPCKVCGATGLHPTAQAALSAQEGKADA